MLIVKRVHKAISEKLRSILCRNRSPKLAALEEMTRAEYAGARLPSEFLSLRSWEPFRTGAVSRFTQRPYLPMWLAG